MTYDDWHTVGDEGEPEFLGDFAAFSGEGSLHTRFYNDGIRTYVEVGVTGTVNNPVFQLPEGYRPDGVVAVPAISLDTDLGSPSPANITAAPDGMIYVGDADQPVVTASFSFRSVGQRSMVIIAN